MHKQQVTAALSLYPEAPVLLNTTGVEGSKKDGFKDLQSVCFDRIYHQNREAFDSSISTSVKEVNTNFQKVVVHCPSLVLNSLSILKQDTLPLVVAMFSLVYQRIESYFADPKNSSDEINNSTSLLTPGNPIFDNWFFVPYSLVRQLLNFDSIRDDYEVQKFLNTTSEIKELYFPLLFSKEKGDVTESDKLLTKFLKRDTSVVKETLELKAFENVFGWTSSKSTSTGTGDEHFLVFTLSQAFRNLLLYFMQNASDSKEAIQSILPYTKIDWHFLRFLPQKNNLRQMYLFIRTNLHAKQELPVQAVEFEYSYKELHQIFGISENSHYATNDSHFIRDKIRNVTDELSKTVGCEYDIVIRTKSKTIAGTKYKSVVFKVSLKSSVYTALMNIRNYLKNECDIPRFSNNWLLISCLRYCSTDEIKKQIEKYKGTFNGSKALQKLKDNDTYTNSISDQLAAYINKNLLKFWQLKATSMYYVNSYSEVSKATGQVIYKDKSKKKIATLNPSQPTKPRGRPKKNQNEVSLEENKQQTGDKDELHNANFGEDEAHKQNAHSNNLDSAFETSQMTLDGENKGPGNYSSESYENQFLQQHYEENLSIFGETGVATFSVNKDNLINFVVSKDNKQWVQDYLQSIEKDSTSLFNTMISIQTIINTVEYKNELLKNRHVSCIDLYKEKMDIVVSMLRQFFGTIDQRDDKSSIHYIISSLALEKYSEQLLDLALNDEEVFILDKKYFAQLIASYRNSQNQIKDSDNKIIQSLLGQCVAYPFVK